MQAARVLAGSAVVHAGVLALFAHVFDKRDVVIVEVPPPVAVTIVPAHVETAPIDVVVLDTPVPAAVTGAAATMPHARVASGRAAIAAQPGGSASEMPGGHDRPTGTGSVFKMRGREVANLRPGDAQLEGIANGGEPLRPGPHTSGRLENAPNGTAVVHDVVTTVTVEKDGTAHLHDKPDIDVHWQLPIRPWEWRVDVKDIGKGIADWAADPLAATRVGRTQDLPEHLRAAPGVCDSFGDLMCDDPLEPGAEKRAREYTMRSGGSTPIFGGKLDLTGYLARKFAHRDVYDARKLKLLDDTRDERAAKGDAYRTRQLEHASELMRKNLEALWKATEDAADRREVLFELWDECAESEGPVGEAGQRARLEVIGWIRAKLPADQPGAFSPADIAALDQRRASKQHFAPYDER